MDFSGVEQTRPWAFFVALAVGIVGLVVGLVLTLIALVPLFVFDLTTASIVIVVSLVMTQGIAFGGIALLYLRWRNLSLDYLKLRFPTRRDAAWAIGGYLLTMVSVVVGLQVVTTIKNQVASDVEPATNSAAKMGMQNPEVLLLLIPAAFLLIGPGEELLFRGIVQNRIREAFGPATGILLASLIFASIHVLALIGSPAARAMSIAILLFPSLVFGVVYELSENLAVTSFMHAAYDATLFAGLYVSIT